MQGDDEIDRSHTFIVLIPSKQVQLKIQSKYETGECCLANENKSEQTSINSLEEMFTCILL